MPSLSFMLLIIEVTRWAHHTPMHVYMQAWNEAVVLSPLYLLLLRKEVYLSIMSSPSTVGLCCSYLTMSNVILYRKYKKFTCTIGFDSKLPVHVIRMILFAGVTFHGIGFYIVWRHTREFHMFCTQS